MLTAHQEKYATYKDLVNCWHGYLPRERCKWFACGPDGVTATHPLLLRWHLEWFTFWCLLTQAVHKKRPLKKAVIDKESVEFMHTVLASVNTVM